MIVCISLFTCLIELVKFKLLGVFCCTCVVLLRFLVTDFGGSSGIEILCTEFILNLKQYLLFVIPAKSNHVIQT